MVSEGDASIQSGAFITKLDLLSLCVFSVMCEHHSQHLVQTSLVSEQSYVICSVMLVTIRVRCMLRGR
jgi:hypothetical protein